MKYGISQFRKLMVGLGVMAVLSAGAIAPAFADEVTGTTSITGGSLAISAADAPTLRVTLNGTDQTVTDTFTIKAKDNTGTGAGWKLEISSTQFSTGGETPQMLSTSAASITAVSAVCDSGTCTDPTNSITYPLTVPTGATAPTAAKLFNAAVDTGMGDFIVTPTFQVAVPANAYAGDYSSTVTLTISSAP